jgi:hypothetical protein
MKHKKGIGYSMNANEAKELSRSINFRLAVASLTVEQYQKLSDDCVELAAYCLGRIADAELGVAELAS